MGPEIRASSGWGRVALDEKGREGQRGRARVPVGQLARRKTRGARDWEWS